VSLDFAIRSCVRNVQDVGSLVLVHTTPGAASLVGAAIDSEDFAQVRGTIAGDDLLLIVMNAPASTAAVTLCVELRERCGPLNQGEEAPLDAAGWITTVEAVGPFVVVHTTAGAASLARVAIIGKAFSEVRAIVAGDDVLLIVTSDPETTEGARTVARMLSELRDRAVAGTAPAWITEVEAVGSLVLVHTALGAASVVAGAIDSGQFATVRGTIADDDLLLVFADADAASEVAREFRLQLFPQAS
jgi:arginine repressor